MKSFHEYIAEAQSIESGSKLAKRGFEFEKQLIAAYVQLNRRPAEFVNICRDMDELVLKEFKKKSIKSIEENKKIFKTPSGGLPKADISFNYVFDDDTTGTYSFSLKTTSAKRVSVHQGTVQQFLKALNLPEDNEDYQILKKGLEQFNIDGSWKGIKQWDKKEQDKFKSKLDSVLDNIARYVMSTGNGGTAADAIILFNPDPIAPKYTVMSDREYLAKCKEMSASMKGMGGIFSYTYPHKQKGKQIQLKIPVILTKSM